MDLWYGSRDYWKHCHASFVQLLLKHGRNRLRASVFCHLAQQPNKPSKNQWRLATGKILRQGADSRCNSKVKYTLQLCTDTHTHGRGTVKFISSRMWHILVCRIHEKVFAKLYPSRVFCTLFHHQRNIFWVIEAASAKPVQVLDLFCSSFSESYLVEKHEGDTHPPLRETSQSRLSLQRHRLVRIYRQADDLNI